ncbi:bacitracin ABC transporter permease [Spirochaeta thermophila DSM 6578]|uniref:Bacitracin ABC transporter permease n=1 Tax=Winmispira thermophila (strain ATCC 700085 / DSM 6578 / Z-1203) TaxID=869211 RepID=G0GDQ4_WINT7|nr:ABC transporter permease [Spirochaeta thermophila]AEJ62184.1 bacitracin ABC transporter permease [Spirochaeta thermophila DSM 6578]
MTYGRMVHAELLSLRRSPIVWLSALAMAFGTTMVGLMIYLMMHPHLIPSTGLLRTKISLFSAVTTWAGHLAMLSQMTAVAGMVMGGFVASFLFGRDFLYGTYRDLLVVPAGRGVVIHARYTVYLLWNTALLLEVIGLGLIFGRALGLPGWEGGLVWAGFRRLVTTGVLAMSLGTIIGCAALLVRGVFGPIGVLVLCTVLGQLFPLVGGGGYFPWSVVAIHSGAAGEEALHLLSPASYVLVVLTSAAGYAGSVLHWVKADHP